MAVYEVGKRYLVPVARGTWFNTCADWVVMGPWHEDGEVFQFYQEHYHLDPRFLPKKYCADSADYDWATAPLINQDNWSNFDGDRYCNPVFYLGLKWRKCLREMPDHPLQLPKLAHVYDELANAVEDRPINLERPICPHRGMDLSTIPVKRGCIECPLHGLRFNATTGAVCEHDEFPQPQGAAR